MTRHGEHVAAYTDELDPESIPLSPVHKPEDQKYTRWDRQHSISRTKPHNIKFVIKCWLPELAGASFSLLCICAMITVLFYENGRSLSQWRLPIKNMTPNTLISLFAMLTKVSLLVPIATCISQCKWHHFESGSRPLHDLQMFDDASRGPWGALKLLFRARRAGLLASWAARITIVALGVDPFVQLAITFPTRQVSLGHESASLPITRAFTAGFPPSGGDARSTYSRTNRCRRERADRVS